jgi:signal recognition particle receptor subunit beta
VLLDTRRVEDCFTAIDYFEEHEIPFLIAINTFDRSRRFHLEEVRDALGLNAEVPIVECDARQRQSVKGVLLGLTEEVLIKRLRTRAVPA